MFGGDTLLDNDDRYVRAEEFIDILRGMWSQTPFSYEGRFYQVDGSPTRSHGGTGIGLAIVRGVAHGHGGDVRFASPANEEILGVPLGGAAFYVILPERPAPLASDPFSTRVLAT